MTGVTQTQAADSSASVAALPSTTAYYYLFSYGSNNVAQLKGRVGRQGDFQAYPAYLDGYVRIFFGISQRWDGGGVATVYEQPHGKVHGTLVLITAEELEKLDKFEWGYDRRKLGVCRQGNSDEPDQVVESFVYVKPNPIYKAPPAQSYMEAIYKQLYDLPRPVHKSSITVRGLDAAGQLVIHGSWSPEQGLVLRQPAMALA